VVILLAVLVFIISLPSMMAHGSMEFFTSFLYYEGSDKSFFDLVFDIFGDLGLSLGGFLLVIFIGRRWKMANFHNEVAEGNEKYTGSITMAFLGIMIQWVCPAILGVLFIFSFLQRFFNLSVL